MAMFDFLKRKERELPLPPPPMPPSPQGRMQGDFEPIRAQQMREWQPPVQEEHHDLGPMPPLPPLPDLEHEEHHDDIPLLPAPQQMADDEIVFDRTVMDRAMPKQEMRAELPMRQIPAKTFVSVNDYKQILNETNMVRQRLMTADDFVKKLQDLKIEEEKSLERWRSQLEDVEKKLAYVDQLIEKSQR